MEVNLMPTGSYQFGLWKLLVSWEGNIVYRVQFVRTSPTGDGVPLSFIKYLTGNGVSFFPFISSYVIGDTIYARIYRAVADIPYGEMRTYREIASISATHPRVVGNAMARNPTALIVPCHRVIATDGTLGGFTPDLQIKKDLLEMEFSKKYIKKYLNY
ncbi:MAG TPA: MGMT family protein [Methanocorpusculum sp.]|nr:MGMT family protein [Methanocorpusculum sp.]